MLIGFGAKTASDYSTPITENGSNKAKNSSFNYYGIDFNIGYTKNATRYYTQGRITRIESHRAGGYGAAPGSSYGIYMSENPISEYYLRIGAKSYNLSFADTIAIGIRIFGIIAVHLIMAQISTKKFMIIIILAEGLSIIV